MFGSFKVLAGDFYNEVAKGRAQFVGNTFHLDENIEKKHWFSLGYQSVKIPALQVETLEVATEESFKKMGGAIGWGLVGGLALGGIGLVAGLLAGGKNKEVTFICKFKDGRKMLAKADIGVFEKIQAACF